VAVVRSGAEEVQHTAWCFSAGKWYALMRSGRGPNLSPKATAASVVCCKPVALVNYQEASLLITHMGI